MEYMAAGLPLLVSETESLKALIEKYKCELTADETAPESIASAINILTGNPERARRMGDAARQAFEREFSYERQFASVLESFRNILCSTARNE